MACLDHQIQPGRSIHKIRRRIGDRIGQENISVKAANGMVAFLVGSRNVPGRTSGTDNWSCYHSFGTFHWGKELTDGSAAFYFFSAGCIIEKIAIIR
jgi:hypothetical protein